MPELPEVETTRRGISPHVLGQRLVHIEIRQPLLRWPVPEDIANQVKGSVVTDLERRAKYLLFRLSSGALLMHLGMSGSLRIADNNSTIRKHDHIDLCFGNGVVLRYHDPRRFGALLWVAEPVEQHWLLKNLGPEPLTRNFGGNWLYKRSRGRRTPIKSFIMDNRIVVGIGNIYANEALFAAGIHPLRAAGQVSNTEYQRLARHIKTVLQRAVNQGGTTLRDFVGSDGTPGYFAQSLQVYGRGGQPCNQCGTTLTEIKIGQRATVLCQVCQQ